MSSVVWTCLHLVAILCSDSINTEGWLRTKFLTSSCFNFKHRTNRVHECFEVMDPTNLRQGIIRDHTQLIITLLECRINIIEIATLFTIERPYVFLADLRQFKSQVRHCEMTSNLKVETGCFIIPEVVSGLCPLLGFTLRQTDHWVVVECLLINCGCVD